MRINVMLIKTKCMISLTLYPTNSNHAVRNVTCVIILLQVNHMCFPVLLEESITYIRIALALHQILYTWHIKKNVKNKVLGPPFPRNQDYITIKVISRRMLVLARLQHILLMNVVMRKYLSSI